MDKGILVKKLLLDKGYDIVVLGYIVGGTKLRRIMAKLGYGECQIHHKQPYCVGGDDCLDNLILLDRADHMLVHIYLTEIFANPPLAYTVQFFSTKDIEGPRTGDENIKEMINKVYRTFKMNHPAQKGSTTEFECRACNITKLKIDYTPCPMAKLSRYFEVWW
jgi:hypothetical protein